MGVAFKSQLPSYTIADSHAIVQLYSLCLFLAPLKCLPYARPGRTSYWSADLWGFVSACGVYGTVPVGVHHCIVMCSPLFRCYLSRTPRHLLHAHTETRTQLRAGFSLWAPSRDTQDPGTKHRHLAAFSRRELGCSSKSIVGPGRG
jgi:hypothetical protein